MKNKITFIALKLNLKNIVYEKIISSHFCFFCCLYQRL